MMNSFFLVIAFVFVLSVLALVGYALFALSPWGRHKDHYRDSGGRRRFESPFLD
jgi:hypothetical protein